MPPKRLSVATPNPVSPSRIPRRKKARNESPDAAFEPDSSASPPPRFPRHTAGKQKTDPIEIGSGSERASSPVALVDITNASSQEAPAASGANAHTIASNSAGTTKPKASAPKKTSTTVSKAMTTKNESIKAAAKVTTSKGGASKSKPTNTTTPDQTNPAAHKEGTAGDQPTSSSTSKRKNVAKPKAATSGAAASSKGKAKAKAIEISDVEDAVFSPMALVAINEIVKNHMNARIEASRFSIAEDMIRMDRLDKEIKKTEAERAMAEALIEVFKLYGRAKAEKIMDSVFKESHQAIQKAEEMAEQRQLALRECEERIRMLEKRILEVEKEKADREQAEQDDDANRYFQEARKRRST
ncbi:hypothetical protein RhiJN_07367 [Ceratobasidium sp. AG-Ba]|nr:hypothetical protein RhiJN_07367 [Ceratobasidium sp. AG-Ba]QRW08221.1 hypothetical protein RhiLY_07220 [Ceratobasidium sp. AG-Ba]